MTAPWAMPLTTRVLQEPRADIYVARVRGGVANERVLLREFRGGVPEVRFLYGETADGDAFTYLWGPS